MNPTLKWCRYCERMLDVAHFNVRRASPDGLGYKCKECAQAYNRRQYLKNPQPFKKRADQWRKANPVRRAEITRASDFKRKEARRLYAKKWRTVINPERWKIQNRLRVNRRRMAGNLSVRQWGLLVQLARGRCVYCDRSARLTLDHLVSVKDGGLTSWDNCVPACQRCNSSKNSKNGPDWAYNRFGLEAGRVISYLILKKSITRHDRKDPWLSRFVDTEIRHPR